MPFRRVEHEPVKYIPDPDIPEMTDQSYKDETLIQNIMLKFKKTGILKHVTQYQGTYGDFANAPDFQEAQNILAEARSMFETVPSHIRQDFDNDPSKFVTFMQNPENREAIEAYGLDASHLPLESDSSDPPRGRRKAKESRTEPSEGSEGGSDED